MLCRRAARVDRRSRQTLSPRRCGAAVAGIEREIRGQPLPASRQAVPGVGLELRDAAYPVVCFAVPQPPLLHPRPNPATSPFTRRSNPFARPPFSALSISRPAANGRLWPISFGSGPLPDGSSYVDSRPTLHRTANQPLIQHPCWLGSIRLRLRAAKLLAPALAFALPKHLDSRCPSLGRLQRAR
jgi:hypothetical protein